LPSPGNRTRTRVPPDPRTVACQRAFLPNVPQSSRPSGTAPRGREEVSEETFANLSMKIEVESGRVDLREPFRSSKDLTRHLQKGGDPAAGSPTATLLRLRPSHRSCLRPLPPCGWVTDFGHYRLPWRDGRCVQGPGTYSPWRC